MKKAKKFVTAVIALAMAFIMAMPMMAFANEPEQLTLQFWEIDGERFAPLRATAEQFGAEVEWDQENLAAIITAVGGGVHVIVIADVGGFIEDGVSWVPQEFVINELIPLLFPPVEFFPFEMYRADPVDRLDLTIWEPENFAEVRETRFSTDLPIGAISVYYIEYMNDNLPARSAFTYRELETAIWIVEELLAMGHDWDNIEVQEFTYWEIVDKEIGLFDLNWWMVTSPMILGVDREYQLRPDRVSQNVVLTIPGQSERTIIIGAHYDSPPYPSASDNASGTALLLESAQRMLELEHYYTLVYVFFGAEEVGLIGAYYFIEMMTPAQSGNIVMMINADVIIEGPYVMFGADAMPVIDDEFAAELAGIIFEAMEENFTEQFYRMVAAREELFRTYGDTIVIFQPEFETLEEWLDMRREALAQSDPAMLAMQAAMMGITEPQLNPVTQRVNDIAAELSEAYDFELLNFPELAAFPTDSLAFLFAGYTVVNLVGLERDENITPELAAQLTRLGEGPEGFTVTILHSPLDEFNMIESLWPGMMDANMRAFGIFLEALLMARFDV